MLRTLSPLVFFVLFLPTQRAAHESYTETISGTKITFDMVAIPGGTFVMGSPASEPGRAADEGPAHEVRIAPFWMERTETPWDDTTRLRSRRRSPPRRGPRSPRLRRAAPTQ